MLRDLILSSLLQYFGSRGQPFPLLGEGSRRRPWQRNAAWASCCALEWSTTPGLEVVFGLLRTGKQFSDKEHHFSSWGEPKCRGVSSEPYPVSPESRCPLANPCLLLQLGYSHSQASQEFQIFRRCPSWVLEVFFSSDPIKHHPPQIGSWPLLGGPKRHRPWQLLAVSSLVPHLLSCFKCFAADPKRNRPKPQLPQKQSLESRAG